MTNFHIMIIACQYMITKNFISPWYNHVEVADLQSNIGFHYYS